MRLGESGKFIHECIRRGRRSSEDRRHLHMVLEALSHRLAMGIKGLVNFINGTFREEEWAHVDNLE
jgi:hypothetical protein